MESTYKVYFSDYKVLNMRKQDIMGIPNKLSIHLCTKKYRPVGLSNYIKEMEIILYTSEVKNTSESYIDNYQNLPGVYGLNALDESDKAVCQFLNDQ